MYKSVFYSQKDKVTKHFNKQLTIIINSQIKVLNSQKFGWAKIFIYLFIF